MATQLILVCASTPTESRACRKGIADAGLAERFEVLETGMGLVRARRSLEQRLARGPRPRAIVSTGLAGALTSELAINAWISTTRVYLCEGELKGFFPAVAAGLDETTDATLVTSNDLVVDHAQLKKRYESLKGPVAVDMETAAWAEIAAREQLPFLVLRMVSDTPDAPLPGFLTSFATAMSATSVVAQVRHGARGLGAALRKPRVLAQLVKDSAGWSSQLRKGWSRRAPIVLKTL